MKVLDLACRQGHGFEGWFASEEDFQHQLARGLVQCPICDDAHITKKLSAPRLNLRTVKENLSSTHSPETDAPAPDAIDHVANDSNHAGANGHIDPQNSPSAPASETEHSLSALMRNPEFQVAYMQMAKEVLAKTEDVGNDFAREARKIHYGESKERGIRGQASHDETMELLDEGIQVMPLPLPKALKGPLQ
jgi:hypothetical protein